MDIKDCWLKDNCKKSIDCPNPFCIKLFKLDRLSELAMLSLKQRKYIQLHLDADGTDREAYTYLSQIEKNIVSFIDSGNNLYIYSNIAGNGKTTWATRLINSYLNNIWYKASLDCKALFVHVPRYFSSLKDSLSEKNDYAQYIKDNILKADIVVFDEIANKSMTVFETDNLLTLISARLDMGKSNIYTSNLCGEELKASIGERLYSRILNNSIVITFKGQDKRGLIQ